MQLTRPRTPPRLISLVSMIDVLLIMLVFFMVTSTYLNLDMIPVARAADETPIATTATADGGVLLVRLGADGQPHLRGKAVRFGDLSARVQAEPDIAITILPSLRASTQSLVTLMDTLTGAGADNLRILQVGAP